MCGALAIKDPSGANIAQEKSSRSLMLTDAAVFSRTTPICSAMDMNRLLNTSSITGSTVSPVDVSSSFSRKRSRMMSLPVVVLQRQPGSTTIVLTGSRMTAGPSIINSGDRNARSYTGVVRHRSSMKHSILSIFFSEQSCVSPWASIRTEAAIAIASTSTDSTMRFLLGEIKPKRILCSFSNSQTTSSNSSPLTIIAVSDPS